MLIRNINILKNIFSSSRPNTWFRIWGEMIVGAVLASSPNFDSLSFIKGFIAVSPLLWTAGYMLNDLTDINLDKEHEVRKNRPITKGDLKKSHAIIIILIFFFLAVILGYTINVTFTILLISLFISQILYTLHPFRLKEKYFWDIFINGINSILRFLLGWFTQVIIHTISIYPIIFLLSIKLIFFLGHRLQNKKLEIENNIKGTTNILSTNTIKLIIYILSIIAAIFFILSILKNIFPVFSIVTSIISILPILIYFIKHKPKFFLQQEKDLKFRNILYLSYFIFTNLLVISILLKV